MVCLGNMCVATLHKGDDDDDYDDCGDDDYDRDYNDDNDYNNNNNNNNSQKQDIKTTPILQWQTDFETSRFSYMLGVL